MKMKRSVYEDREEAIRLAIKRKERPIMSDELFDIVQAFFSCRQQFSGTIGGMTRAKRVLVEYIGDVRFYRLPDGAAPVETTKGETPSEASAIEDTSPPLRIDELYTRGALALVASIRLNKPRLRKRTNSADKARDGSVEQQEQACNAR